MSKIKILIVEDELIIAEDMKEMLIELGYEVTNITGSTSEALDILNANQPDIALIDIQLRKGKDGIDLASHIRENFSFPFIFISSHSDKATVERAKRVQPDGYIVKPFEKYTLYTAIEIALSNFLKSNTNNLESDTDNYFFKEYLFVKKKYQFEKVRINDIKWVKSDGNYLILFCGFDKKYLIRSTFKELYENVNLKSFVQVHKSYAVNFEHIDTIRVNEVVIGQNTIPIGKAYQNIIRKKLKIVY